MKSLGPKFNCSMKCFTQVLAAACVGVGAWALASPDSFLVRFKRQDSEALNNEQFFSYRFSFVARAK